MLKRFLKLAGPPLVLIAVVSARSASAQSSAADARLVEAELPVQVEIEDRLNAAGLCAPLQFDLRSVSALLGFPIPAFIPIDTNLRWDQSRHRVERFASSPDKVELDFKLGCQPSTNGVALEFFGLSPDKVRLDDDVKCRGDRQPNGDLDGLTCTVDGKIGRFLAKNIIGLSDKVGKLLPMNLAVPVGQPAQPSPDAASATGTVTPPGPTSATSSDGEEKPAKPSPAPGLAGSAKAGTAGGPAGAEAGGTNGAAAPAPSPGSPAVGASPPN